MNNNQKIKIGIKLESDTSAQKPVQATIGASGYDLCSKVNTTIPSKKYAMIPTGIFLEMPIGIEAQIRPRSGLAAKFGVTVLNSPGTIDSDYRGEICVLLINHGDNDFIVKQGMRIAQMVFAKVIEVELCDKDELSVSERNMGGFGSTGM